MAVSHTRTIAVALVAWAAWIGTQLAWYLARPRSYVWFWSLLAGRTGATADASDLTWLLRSAHGRSVLLFSLAVPMLTFLFGAWVIVTASEDDKHGKEWRAFRARWRNWPNPPW